MKLIDIYKCMNYKHIHKYAYEKLHEKNIIWFPYGAKKLYLNHRITDRTNITD